MPSIYITQQHMDMNLEARKGLSDNSVTLVLKSVWLIWNCNEY